MSTPIPNRYDFIIIFDVENGNPNGDPDAGNLPRTDPNEYGIVTDVCLKRKIRNYVELEFPEDSTKPETLKSADMPNNPNKIFIKECLNEKLESAYDNSGNKKKKGDSEEDLDEIEEDSDDDSEEQDTSSDTLFKVDGNVTDKKKTSAKKEKPKKELDRTVEEVGRKYMCRHYFDVRTFGAVMSTGKAKCGIVRGPVQLTFAKSIDKVNVEDISITRQAITTTSDYKRKNTEFGNKSYIPYALYRGEGFISAELAQKTFFSDDDLKLLWDAMINMFEHDRSAARGKMVLRELIIFKHDDKRGNAKSHILLEKVVIDPIGESPTNFKNYTINRTGLVSLPEGIECAVANAKNNYEITFVKSYEE